MCMDNTKSKLYFYKSFIHTNRQKANVQGNNPNKGENNKSGTAVTIHIICVKVRKKNIVINNFVRNLILENRCLINQQ